MAFFGVGAGEALGPEFLRLAPEGRMPVQHIGTDEYTGARRNGIAAELVRLERAARDQPTRRIEPQRLLQHLVGELERLCGVQPERLIGTRAIGFGLQPRLGLGMLTDEIPGPGERRPSGLVPGEDQRQYRTYQ